MPLIDANELKSLFNEQIARGATDLLAAFDDALQDVSTVDAIVVVRCGNCKFSEPIPENSGLHKGDWLHCRKWRGELTENVWNPKEKRWTDWSVTVPEGFCDGGDARDEREEDG